MIRELLKSRKGIAHRPRLGAPARRPKPIYSDNALIEDSRLGLCQKVLEFLGKGGNVGIMPRHVCLER